MNGDLRRSDPNEPGIVRRRHGRGFGYYSGGEQIKDAETLTRIRALAIPPAWTEVWICATPEGHLQAVGTDSAGRRQYRYHDLWREQQDRDKFEHVLDLATELPKFRDTVAGHLAGRGLTRVRVLAAAARMLDIGFFRVGGAEYTDSFGLATLRSEHVTCRKGKVICSYPAKGGKPREQVVADEAVCKVIRSLLARPAPELLRYRENGEWHDVTSNDVNEYLREVFGREVSAKDFRTWHATVLAAVGLAVSARARTRTGRRRAVTRVMNEVAGYLGNTPAVARASYVDPRLIVLYEKGRTIDLSGLGKGDPIMATQGAAERSVISLLRDAQWP
ncbi:DNA topoisomerase [Microtetraspora sp. NBRC 13810]|uniref:DNA topoisomerase IB n=1 Tax=Microtetraspora sp. NBRC 13810 TaxID=3030990 RepID=UPI0024A2BDB0|nr:DNA topoisomerase IB [Microtetraspora sp. NBRC 13810]GLW09675.1 DNA topoisomerase [Microtetraspora sp. NBRC 13810]